MEPNTEIRLATYNLRTPCDAPPYNWEVRSPRVKALIADNAFDIFGVQEAVKRQIDDILRDTDYAKIGGGRANFDDEDEHSCIFYDTKRFTLLDGGTFALSETPDVPGSLSWDTKYPRIASWGIFHDGVTGKDFCYYNTHLDHISELARVEGIKLVVDHASKNCKGLPLILTGDFNARPNSETYRIASLLLNDAVKISETERQGPAKTFHGYGRPNLPDSPIDYIFVSSVIKVKSVAVDDRQMLGGYTSDHYPVWARLVI